MSETSAVDICNSAIRLLGRDQIVSLLDATRQAEYANHYYSIERDWLLSKYPANFSTARAALPQLADAPVWRYTYAYQLPSGCLRVLDMKDEDIWPWQIEQVDGAKALVTDASTCSIRYIKQITDPNQFSEPFKRLLATRLAVIIAWPLTGKKSVVDYVSGLFEEAELEFMSADSQEGTSNILEETTYTDAREGSGFWDV